MGLASLSQLTRKSHRGQFEMSLHVKNACVTRKNVYNVLCFYHKVYLLLSSLLYQSMSLALKSGNTLPLHRPHIYLIVVAKGFYFLQGYSTCWQRQLSEDLTYQQQLGEDKCWRRSGSSTLSHDIVMNVMGAGELLFCIAFYYLSL